MAFEKFKFKIKIFARMLPCVQGGDIFWGKYYPKISLKLCCSKGKRGLLWKGKGRESIGIAIHKVSWWLTFPTKIRSSDIEQIIFIFVWLDPKRFFEVIK